MAIDVPAAELYALADALRAQAAAAGEVTGWFSGIPAVGGPLEAAVEEFLAAQRTGAEALAGELGWLGSTVAAVTASWLRLDGSMLAPRGRVTPR